MSKRLEEIKARRVAIQSSYLELAQSVWNSNIEADKKDSKVRLAYNKYKNEDRHLERMQQMEESLIEDLNWYKETFIK